MRHKKLLVMGLPGSGKTTLATLLAKYLVGVHLNADEIRANVNKDLGFSIEDRIEQARRMGWLCDQVVKSNSFAVADFICPTSETRAAFGEAFTVWVDRIKASRFDDTNRLFVPPAQFDLRVRMEGSAEYWATRIVSLVRPVFDPKRPTALFIGRWQPFHDGHLALIEEGISRVGQVCIGVRDTHGTSEADPLSFEGAKCHIEAALAKHAGKFCIISVPNVASIFYGRDVGYSVERLTLSEGLESISGTAQRRRMGLTPMG